jgi:acetyltransferase-like isoleucine patch superfamily enzyme
VEGWDGHANAARGSNVMGRWIIGLVFRILLSVAYWAQKAEGLNALFLILPARLIIPTLKKHGAMIGEGVQIHSPLQFHNVSDCHKEHYANLSIGKDCYFGKDVFLDLADEIVIEDYVTVSMRVTILTHSHAGKSPISQNGMPPSYASVILRKGCYVGAGAILMPGVEIGEGAIVGAGAVVTKNVASNSKVVGIPAEVRVESSFLNDWS